MLDRRAVPREWALLGKGRLPRRRLRVRVQLCAPIRHRTHTNLWRFRHRTHTNLWRFRHRTRTNLWRFELLRRTRPPCTASPKRALSTGYLSHTLRFLGAASADAPVSHASLRPALSARSPPRSPIVQAIARAGASAAAASARVRAVGEEWSAARARRAPTDVACTAPAAGAFVSVPRAGQVTCAPIALRIRRRSALRIVVATGFASAGSASAYQASRGATAESQLRAPTAAPSTASAARAPVLARSDGTGPIARSL